MIVGIIDENYVWIVNGKIEQWLNLKEKDKTSKVNGELDWKIRKKI